ncbi:MAG TPA: 1-deoxy-D-xylulose-5-phosphate reductoisomerase [Candidatus Tumulicola sp.]
MSRRRIAILGSTGSIGTQALDVIAQHLDRFEVVALAAGRNRAMLQEQSERFGPQIATTAEDGPGALQRVAVESKPDVVLAATDGAVAFDAVFAAVERGIDIAVANKELIVSAGELLVASAAHSGSRLLPVDSEHSAIFQCLEGERPDRVREIVLTASGGPFWRWTAERIAEAELEAALAHPTWRMGTKNTIDSATMMNKGLEVIEASRLFGVPGDRVRFVVHPQSIAHGFVVFSDGSVKAQLAAPDMRIPIGYALAYPDRLPDPPTGWTGAESTLAAIGGVTGAPLRYDFEPADPVRFPCVRLAYEALAAGGTVPAVLSAANEVAVAAFVERKIGFGDIPVIIEAVMVETGRAELTLAQIRTADRQARIAAERAVQRMERPLCR